MKNGHALPHYEDWPSGTGTFLTGETSTLSPPPPPFPWSAKSKNSSFLPSLSHSLSFLFVAGEALHIFAIAAGWRVGTGKLLGVFCIFGEKSKKKADLDPELHYFEHERVRVGRITASLHVLFNLCSLYRGW